MAISLIQDCKQFIQQHALLQQQQPLLLAVSGGVDSVVLVDLCHQLSLSFVIAHCNFNLRGEESNRDEAFVKSLAAQYQVPIFIKHFNTAAFANENKSSIQVAARELRYNWFQQISTDSTVVNALQHTNTEHKVNVNLPVLILTAHHANDSMETLLMNFFKGTGIKGLQGIQAKNPQLKNIIRPLLFATKKQLIQYAQENKLSFVEDSSNAKDQYTRNYFRNQLLPNIATIFPSVEDNLQDNLARFADIETLYNQAIAIHTKKLVVQKGNEIHLPILQLQKSKPLPTILFEIIKDFGFTANQVTDVIGLLNSSSGKYVQSATHRIINNRKWLIIALINNLEANTILIEAHSASVAFEAGVLTFKNGKPSNIQAANNAVQLNAAEIKYPLLLRKWKQGDYFYPLGMQKKKKLSKFFIDQKLSLPQKENTWVLEMDKKIVWVIGLRLDDRFRITEKTTQQLTISFTKN
jgi:tRNA(Ile)-lysidine synthase